MIALRNLLALVPLLLGGAAAAQLNPNDVAAARQGMSWQQGHKAQWHLDQHRRFETAIAAIRPERKGVVDAFVLVAGLDADPVFAREAAETAKVLSRRYDAAGRTLLLASGSATAPDGSPANLAAGLAAIAGKMNKAEDTLVLYATAHGAPGIGVVYKDADKSYGMIAPERLSAMLDELGIKRRLILISACYAGQFVDGLATPDSAIVTAADNDRTSFGCDPGNDWTFFGDALINNAMRKPTALAAACDEAFGLISQWEFTKGLTSSKPRMFVGDQAKLWLAALEKRMPPGATPRTGRPSIEEAKTVPTGR